MELPLSKAPALVLVWSSTRGAVGDADVGALGDVVRAHLPGAGDPHLRHVRRDARVHPQVAVDRRSRGRGLAVERVLRRAVGDADIGALGDVVRRHLPRAGDPCPRDVRRDAGVDPHVAVDGRRRRVGRLAEDRARRAADAGHQRVVERVVDGRRRGGDRGAVLGRPGVDRRILLLQHHRHAAVGGEGLRDDPEQLVGPPERRVAELDGSPSDTCQAGNGRSRRSGPDTGCAGDIAWRAAAPAATTAPSRSRPSRSGRSRRGWRC
jgi:hypothetical protein